MIPISVIGQLLNPVVLGTTTTTSNMLLTGLQAYYKFDEAGAGTRADSSANGLNLSDVLNNMASSTLGALNNCCDGVSGNSYLSHSNDTHFQIGGNQDFTITCWFNTLGATMNSFQTFIDKGPFSGAGDEYALGFENTGKPRFIVGNGSSFGSALWTSVVNDSNWHFCCGWYDSTAQTVNIQVDNGTPVNQSWTLGTIATTRNVVVGADGNGVHNFTRRFDEMGFWKRVLTSSERAALYGSGTPLTFSQFGSTP